MKLMSMSKAEAADSTRSFDRASIEVDITRPRLSSPDFSWDGNGAFRSSEWRDVEE